MTQRLATLATRDDIDAVHALLARAGEALAAAGFTNWVPPYPREKVAEAVRQGVLYAVREMADGRRQKADARLVATYILRPAPVHPYVGIAWGTPDDRARYLNRLAVDPALQGTGIGAWCLEEIARHCTREGATAIRCDVIKANTRLCRFYERGGYVARGEREHSGWHFTVYERVLAD